MVIDNAHRFSPFQIIGHPKHLVAVLYFVIYRKKLRSSNNEADLDTILADIELSFHDTDEMFSFPVPRERSHSTSMILQNYTFEEDDDPISIV